MIDTKGTRLGIEMSKLVDEWGITAVTCALIDKVENNQSSCQMDTLKEAFRDRINDV